jgi:hypothetical protein
MRSKWKGVLAAGALGVLAVGAVVIVGMALGGGSNGTTTRAAYQKTVVNARDRVDFALELITRSRSPKELIARLEEASRTVGGAADDVGKAKVAAGFDDENAKLADKLRAFSDELANTADTLRDPTFAGSVPGLNSLSFDGWTAVNRVLVELESQGIHVPLLARH